MNPQGGQGAQMGANIVGQYALERPLGEGGMAEVWLARNLHLGTPAAVKFLNRAYAGHPEIEQRFLNEGRRQGALNHPNIVKVYGFEYVNGRSFLILQYIDGEPLDRILKRLGRLDARETVRLITGVLNALECAHSNNIVHRDIKPSNILVDSAGFPYLGDFGIVLAMNEQRVTKAGMTMGTSYYMSPEQITNPGGVDYRADIYSIGCVIYEMLTGHTPFEPAVGSGDTDFAVKMAHVQQTPKPLRVYDPGIKPELERVVMQCLAKDPNYRPQTCGQLRDALNAAIYEGPVAPPARTSRAWAAVAIPAILVLLAVAGWYGWTHMHASYVVDDVHICQGAYDGAKDTCAADVTSRVLTVYGNFHGAKPKQSTLRVEWWLNGKSVQKPDPHYLTAEKGFYHQQFGSAADKGEYKVAVYADDVFVGDKSITLAEPTFGIDSVAICQGNFDTTALECKPDPTSRVLTLYTNFHDGRPGQTSLREIWEYNGTAVQQPEAHVLQHASGTYYQQYGTAEQGGEYKVTLYANNAPIGNAVVHMAAPTTPIPTPTAAVIEGVSICQGVFNNNDATCRTDPNSRQLALVAKYHGATANQTNVRSIWELNGHTVQTVDTYALKHDSGTYYDPFKATEPGDYKGTIWLDGAYAGSATVHVPEVTAPPASNFTVESVSICRGEFDDKDGVCHNNPSSNLLSVVLRFKGAVPDQTQVHAEWSLYGSVIKKTDPFTLHYQNGWYKHRYGTATIWGNYKATVYVNGSVAGSAVAHVGL